MGSVVVPPWIHRRLACVARFASSAVRANVTAPSIVRPVGLELLSSSGTESWVVMSWANGLVTMDREPHGPLTARDLYPRPSVNFQSLIGRHRGWLARSMSGSIAWPAA